MPFDVRCPRHEWNIVEVEDLRSSQQLELEIETWVKRPEAEARTWATSRHCDSVQLISCSVGKQAPTRRFFGTEIVSNNDAAELWMRSNAMATVLNNLGNSPKACILIERLRVKCLTRLTLEGARQGRDPRVVV